MGHDFWKAPSDSIILESRPLLSRTCVLTPTGVRWRPHTTGMRASSNFLLKELMKPPVDKSQYSKREHVGSLSFLPSPFCVAAQPRLTDQTTHFSFSFSFFLSVLYSNTSPACSTSTRKENLTERPGLRLKNVPPHLSWLLILSYLRMSNPFYLSPLLYLFMSLFIFRGDVTESIALTWIGGCYLVAEVYSAVTLIHPSASEASLYTWFILSDIYRHPGANHWYWFSIPWVGDIFWAAD